eukprot:3007410-Pyramimonas_sp.AAC.1
MIPRRPQERLETTSGRGSTRHRRGPMASGGTRGGDRFREASGPDWGRFGARVRRVSGSSLGHAWAYLGGITATMHD